MSKIRFSSDDGRPQAPAIDRREALVGGATAGLGILAAGGALLRSGPALAAPQVGQPAPTFSATDTKGVLRSLASLNGKVVVLEWTNAECPFVAKHYNSANMQKLQKEATAAGAIWLSIISSGPGEEGYVQASTANALTVARDAAPTGVILDPDGKIGHAYGAQTTPHMYIIDAKGVLRYVGGIDSIPSTHVADVPKAQPLFEEAFLAVSQGRPVKNAVTRPYGCSVKYSV
ncbi:redoxin domain-containing protein [Methylosinus sp. PW1]|uniref:redoxin domain-containing protein n=1 Tax=Methylosinus sp. PW1 TaxID=107636 RepID=UPI0009FBAE87|nr:redoxin domain-containing protein [Methylosinus sp. PW1]